MYDLIYTFIAPVGITGTEKLHEVIGLEILTCGMALQLSCCCCLCSGGGRGG